MEKKYLPRLVDEKVEKYIKNFGAICIEGPKWCGKTWTSMHHSKSRFFLGDPVGNFQNRNLAKLSPSMILEGETPRLIDEWQEVPELWDAVRFEVDQRAEKGQFILTGSSTPEQKGTLHSGAGRIATLRMRPMTLFESQDSSGEISLQDICGQKFTSKMFAQPTLDELVYYIIRGGWPAALTLPKEDAALLPKEYLQAVINHDIYRLEGINRDTKKMHMLLRSLARNESTTASLRTLKKDIEESDDVEIEIQTISNYLSVFERLFLIENQPAFSSNIRSSVRIKQAEKRHFVDPSLACALLNADRHTLINDLNTLGFLFESLCIRDLRIYAETFGAKLFHYQDYKGKEMDCVLELEDGNWVAVEIKLGANQIDEAAKNLLAIQKEMQKDNAKAPAVLCVVCGLSNAAYLREDGVYVVPITALRN
ncbi:MAG: DUF4143 domain-containing protein [Peptostreptococcaceae bacterium]|nr:DUF4143 domain-containing protein [Peptostreptococcaceae bacterium]